jgi:hypothetical protein
MEKLRKLAAWHLATAARIGDQVTPTKFDMIGF